MSLPPASPFGKKNALTAHKATRALLLAAGVSFQPVVLTCLISFSGESSRFAGLRKYAGQPILNGGTPRPTPVAANMCALPWPCSGFRRRWSRHLGLAAANVRFGSWSCENAIGFDVVRPSGNCASASAILRAMSLLSKRLTKGA